MTDRGKIKSITRMVLENDKILSACPLHDFAPMNPAEHPAAFKKYKCRHCGGTVDLTRRQWYERGLKHGKELHERNRIFRR